MFTRQRVFESLFQLKDAGIDVSVPLRQMSSNPDVPQEVLDFLRENSPQYQFYAYLKHKQKAIIKNILNYESLTNIQKIKVCSSFITRAMIAVEYKEISELLLSELKLISISQAITIALEYNDYSQIDKLLEYYKMIFSTRKEEKEELVNNG